MKREVNKSQTSEKKSGLSEKEFIEYLEERYRKLKLDEQKFREEVLARGIYPVNNSKYIKMNS